MFLASSNAELSLTPRYAEVAVTELCPSKIPHLLKNTPSSGITWVLLKPLIGKLYEKPTHHLLPPSSFFFSNFLYST
jgi:hypothetical protein